MSRLLIIVLLVLLPGTHEMRAQLDKTTPPIEYQSTDQLELRLAAIETTVHQMASYSLRSGVGSVGYMSDPHEESSHTEWVQVDLGSDVAIDEIVLVPAIWRDAKFGLRADGFPVEFTLIAGQQGETNGRVVARFSAEDQLLPRIAPLVVPVTKTVAAWIRLEATVLSPRIWDGRYILQLSELMVFNGEENVALNCTVSAPVPVSPEGLGRRKEFLVDGFVPYVMDAYEGDQSVAFVGAPEITGHPSLTIDLGASFPVNRVHLHGPDLSDTVPQAYFDDFGFPLHLLVEGANKRDFSDAAYLFEYRRKSIYEIGPIVMRRFRETSCRYVRLTAVEPFFERENNRDIPVIAFAEIEVFSRGRNVALGKTIQANFRMLRPDRTFAALTDGRNFYGNILTIREWMTELALRHDLQSEHSLITPELTRRYASQTAKLKWMGWLAALLGIGICIIVLTDKIVRQRQVTRIKQRFSADLHDEIGANLHTIGLLSDLADESKGSPEKSADFLKRIRGMTERTGTAVRHCTDMLEATDLFSDLRLEMRRAAERIAPVLEHDFCITGEDYIDQLKPQTGLGLFLFYKECLINICRHAGATHIRTVLTASSKEIHLRITDNGRGLPNAEVITPPASLIRRATLLGAKISVESPASGGTCITLTLKTRSWIRRR